MSCPEPQQLQQLLDESLPVDQAQSIHMHLEICEHCQKKIEQLAAGGITWDKTAQHLSAESKSDETAFLEAVDKLQNEPTSAMQTQAEAAKSFDEDLTFLQPSQKPGSLGRLDEFEILSVVGKGGFGVVLKAFDENLHRIVAIKVMLPHLAANGTARERFIREAKAAAAVTHENIVTIHAVQKQAKIPYLVMQFVSGVTLNDKIDKGGPLPVKEILRVGMQVAEGLAAAHKQGLIHRDIKPGNILLENGIERVKITDFGLARAADDASVTQSGTVAGTPMYMSPEQANGEVIDVRSDLFSLGSVLYVMCTGRPPFRATSTMAVMKRVCEDTPTPVTQVNADIPEWLGAIITKLHAKKPGDRFQSAKEVADLLGQHLANIQHPSGASTAAAKTTMVVSSEKPAPTPGAVPASGWSTILRHTLLGWLSGAAGGFLFGIFAIFMGYTADSDGVRREGFWRAGNFSLLLGMAWGVLLGFILGVIRWVLYQDGKRVTGRLLLTGGILSVVAAASSALLVLYGPPWGSSVVVQRIQADQVLPRLVGTWSVESEMTKPKREIVRGKVRFEWVANGKFLRAYANMEWGGESMTIYSFDERTKTFRRWFFSSDGDLTSIQGPQEGHWDMTKSVLALEGDLPLFHKVRHEDHWASPDKFEVRTVVTNNMGGVEIEHTKKMQRIGDENVGPKLPPDPKRSAEFVQMDHMLGNWTKKADVTLAELGGKTVQSESTTKDVAILGGRVIETYEHTPRGNRDDYLLFSYDEFRKTYRFWHFSPSGEVTEADGVWHKDENKIEWKSLDGRMSGMWMFPNPGERRVKMSAKDAQGRRLYEVAAIARRADAPEEGWVQLFNGKDLNGWKTHPDQPGDWKVDNGILVGSSAQSYLFSDRGNYENFHLRVEAKINQGADSGVFFRAPFAMRPGRQAGHLRPAGGFEAELQLDPAHSAPTGSAVDFETNGTPILLSKAKQDALVKPDEWFTLEIVAQGNHFITTVNRVQTADCRIQPRMVNSGHFALQVFNAQTVVQFKKIEIKELPPDGAEQVFAQAPDIVAEDLDGKPFRLSDHRGKVVLVDFWADWCPYCRNLIAYKRQLVDRLAGQPFVLMGVNLDKTSAQAKKAIQREKLNWPSIWDREGVSGDMLGPICRAYTVHATPTLVIIDQRGKIRFRQTGMPKDVAALDKIIDQLLAEAASEPGWVQLFNGKDLIGWDRGPSNEKSWTVADGVLKGTMLKDSHHYLYTKRTDFENFQLRMQAHLNPGGSAAVVLHAPRPGVKLNGIAVGFAHKKPGELALSWFAGLNPYLPLSTFNRILKPDHWFDIEIKSVGPRVTVLIDGQPSATHLLNPGEMAKMEVRGAIRIEVSDAKSTLSVRKIELKELPPTAPAPAPKKTEKGVLDFAEIQRQNARHGRQR